MNSNEKEYNHMAVKLQILIAIIILLHILITYLGKIEHKEYLVPTGNVDIFDITCVSDNCCKEKDQETEDVPTFNEKNGLIVYDKYTIYQKSELRIFENPAYQYKSIIAPGSSNTYNFIIRNNNMFAVKIDINMEETNKYDLVLKYRLRKDGTYILGNADTWVTAKDLKVYNIKLQSKEYNTYFLDWKWEFSQSKERDKKDTEIGFNANENYKLSIIIKANEG